LSEVWNGKKTRMQLLMNKTGEVEEERRVNDARMGQL